jgi:hypothetical protein
MIAVVAKYRSWSAAQKVAVSDEERPLLAGEDQTAPGEQPTQEPATHEADARGSAAEAAASQEEASRDLVLQEPTPIADNSTEE